MNYIEYLREVERLSVEGLKSKREVSEEAQEKYADLVEDQQYRWGEKND